MAFGDLLIKKATEKVADVAGKGFAFAEKAKNQVEKHQAAIEAAVYIDDDTAVHGYIDGEILPKDTNAKQFNIGKEKLVVFDDFAPKQLCIKTKKRWLYEIPLIDIVSFKIKESKMTEHDNYDYADYTWELGLASGDLLTIKKSIDMRKDGNSFGLERENRAIFAVGAIMFNFIDKISDGATKLWVNEYYNTDIFNNNGEISIDCYEKMNQWYEEYSKNFTERVKNLSE